MDILAPHKQKYFYTKPLACLLGDANAASILSKIHHWLDHGSGRIFDGVRWIHNSYKDFVKEFPWLTVAQVRRLINGMRSLGVLKAEALTRKACDDIHSHWYTIDYETLDSLLSQGNTKKSKRRNDTTPDDFSGGHVKNDTTPDDFDNCSIYTNISTKKTPIENNITETAADRFLGEGEIEFQEEEEPPTSLADNPAQPVRTEIVGEKVDREDMGASSARYHNNVVTLKYYGIALNKQLEKIATKYSEKEVERSLEYMEERIEAGKTIANKAGWLTDCLKDEWWRQSSKSVEEALILEGLSEMGYSLNNPEAFFDEMWLMVSEGFIDPMPTDRWDIEGLVGNYLQITDGITYVNWADWSWQKKLDRNIFQSMSLTEAKRRFYEER